MSKVVQVRHDIKVRVFPEPPAGLDHFKADDATILRHGFIPRPTGHPKLLAIWERLARRTTRIVQPRVDGIEHRIIKRGPVHPAGAPTFSSWSGADFLAPRNTLLNWITASWTIPTGYGQPANEPTGGGCDNVMGVSLGRVTLPNNFVIAGVVSSSRTVSPLSAITTSFCYCTGDTFITIPAYADVNLGDNVTVYLRAALESGVNVAHILFFWGPPGQDGYSMAVEVMNTAPSNSDESDAPYSGAGDSAWTVEGLGGPLMDYGRVTFSDASTGGANTCTGPAPSYEPNPTNSTAFQTDASVGFVPSAGVVECSKSFGS